MCDTVCPAGTYSRSLFEARPCPHGSFLNDTGSNASLHDSLQDCKVCPSGKYVGQAGAPICQSCPTGLYISDGGTDVALHDSQDDCSGCQAGEILLEDNGTCTVCPAGKYAPRSGLSDCSVCPSGFYNADPASSASLHASCTPCPSGRYNLDSTGDVDLHDTLSDCAICPGGWYAPAQNSWACIPCPVGTHLPDQATSPSLHDTLQDCRVCSAGMYTNITASPNCIACPPDSFLVDDSGDKELHDDASDCVACFSGQRSGAGAHRCEACAAGTFAAFNMSSNEIRCEPCPAGSFQSKPGRSSCDACPSGYTQLERGQPYCLPCVPGTFRLGAAKPCATCPRGYFSNTSAQDFCAPCAPGTYAMHGAARCLQCLPGYYSSRYGSLSCDSCPAGYEGPRAGLTVCLECREGMYSPSNSSSCVSCRARSSSPKGARLASECLCDQGYWSSSDDVCQVCSLHAFCRRGCKAPVTSPGFWRVTWRSEHDAEARLRCLSKSACLGPTAQAPATNETCAPFHRGPLCAACGRGSYRVTGKFDCVACYENEALSALFVLLLAAGAVGIITLVAWLTLKDGGEAAAVDVMVAKVTMNHFVIASGAATFPLRWPPAVRALMSTMSLMSASAMGESAFSVDCVSRTGTMRPVQVWGLVTVLAPPCLVLGARLLLCRYRSGDPAFPVTVLVILILGHPTICKGSFNLFSCRTVGGRSFLEADMDIPLLIDRVLGLESRTRAPIAGDLWRWHPALLLYAHVVPGEGKQAGAVAMLVWVPVLRLQ